MPDGFIGLFVVMAVLVAIGFAINIVRSVARYSTLRSGGLNPFVAREQLEAKLNQSSVIAPAKTLEQRLTELDDLRDRGVITEDERAAARAKVLAEG
jgi:hypothetical protein